MKTLGGLYTGQGKGSPTVHINVFMNAPVKNEAKVLSLPLLQRTLYLTIERQIALDK